MTSPTTLVLGATGKTGRRLVGHLRRAGADVRPASRHPGVDGTLFDWHRPETHRPALDGADAVYLVAPELVEDPSDVVGPFLADARRLGVRRVVLLSQFLPDGVLGRVSGLHRVEQLVKGSQLGWAILRPTAFAQNLSEGFQLPGILHQDAVVAPSGNGAVGFVDAGDIAAVAATALTGNGHAGETYVLTGPEALTHADAAERISAVTGRTITHADIAPAELRGVLTANGMPDDYAEMVVAFFVGIREHRMADVSGDVERVIGRPATSFAEFVRGAAHAWVPVATPG